MNAPKKKSKKPKKEEGFNQPFGALKGLKKQLEDDEKKREGAGTAPVSRVTVVKKSEGAAESNEEEALSFHRMMSGVTPLDQPHGRVSRSQEKVERSPAAELADKRAHAKKALELEVEQVHDHLRALAFGAARFEVADDGRRVEGWRVDLPPDAVRKLRRGRLPIDARLDLHGSTTTEARAKLEVFLREKRARGERCVLIVHGKGEHSPGGVGVLRGEIAAWLSQGASSEHVAAFATAMDSDGGEGAVYVLIRR